MIKQSLIKLLQLPQLRGFQEKDFDTPDVLGIQRGIFKQKKVLRTLYREYCRPFLESFKNAPRKAKILEIGSGVSPLKELIPEIISSDLVVSPWLDLVSSAYALPFRNNSLDRIFLMFCCHHLGNAEEFLREAYRCLKPAGEMVIIDPAITLFSKFYYRYFHTDRIDLKSEVWGFHGNGRLSDSNIALPWIIFFRDRQRFLKLYPGFRIEKVEYNTCLSFLLSGGLRIRQLCPTRIIEALFKIENWVIKKFTKKIAVTMVLSVRKVSCVHS
ncbi:MAG: hypothetical protein DRP74_03570 [Candidatus Omnitrophota bacterium]|nr:MAG: hypothetical protein DRP74_03570 [Candidatus Omnitrophota bacterium]